MFWNDLYILNGLENKKPERILAFVVGPPGLEPGTN